MEINSTISSCTTFIERIVSNQRTVVFLFFRITPRILSILREQSASRRVFVIGYDDAGPRKSEPLMIERRLGDLSRIYREKAAELVQQKVTARWMVIFAALSFFLACRTGLDAFWPAKTNARPIWGRFLSKRRPIYVEEPKNTAWCCVSPSLSQPFERTTNTVLRSKIYMYV